MSNMFAFFQRKSFWAQAGLAIAWACWPAFIVNLLVLQVSHFSRLRFALSVLLVPFLASIAYRNMPKLRSLPLRCWSLLALGSAIISLLGGIALSSYPEKIYLLSPQHKLKMEILKFTEGQTLQIGRFQTSFGDVGNNSFQGLDGWVRKGNVFRPTAVHPAPLTWAGWTGDLTRLYLSGSTGVVINVTWDGQSKVIDFGQTGGHAVIQQGFSTPLWEILLLALLLWGTILYVASIVLVNSRTDLSEAFFPLWAGYILIAGFIFSLAILVVQVPLEYTELLLLISVGSVAIVPIYVILYRLPKTRSWQNFKLQQHSTSLIFLFSTLLVLGIFGRSLWTNWSIIDDHEIVSFLGPGGKMSISEMFATLPHTEIGLFGKFPRFRPSYFFLRLLECVLWGAHPLYWHAFRVVILVFAVSWFWILVRPSLGWLGGGLLCAYSLTFPYWSDVIGRLGPGETYAVAGLPIYIWGMVSALREDKLSRKREYLAGIAILLGGIICIGSKENFLLLVFPTLYLGCKMIRSKRSSIFASALGTILFALYVGSSVLLAAIRNGTDIYANPVSPLIRLEKILAVLQTTQNLTPFLILIGITVILGLILFNRDLSDEKRRSVLWTQFWLVILCLIYLSQLFFYNGVWPTGIRYDFPGLLYIPASIYVIVWLGQKMVPEADKNTAVLALKTSLIFALTLAVVFKGYAPIIQTIDENVKTTTKFTQGLERIVSLLRGNTDYALVIESGRALDYEPIFSYETYLRAYGVNNKLFLRPHGYSLETASPNLEQNLTASLLELSKNGNDNFLPLDQLQSFGDKCFSLSLSGSFATECKPIQ